MQQRMGINRSILYISLEIEKKKVLKFNISMLESPYRSFSNTNEQIENFKLCSVDRGDKSMSFWDQRLMRDDYICFLEFNMIKVA